MKHRFNCQHCNLENEIEIPAGDFGISDLNGKIFKNINLLDKKLEEVNKGDILTIELKALIRQVEESDDPKNTRVEIEVIKIVSGGVKKL